MEKMGKKYEAKMKMLEALKKLGHDSMAEEIFSKPMQKVTVAAPDKEGLKKGLDKAGEVLDAMPKMKEMIGDDEEKTEEMDNSEEESMESEEESESSQDLSSLSKEELIALLKKKM